MTLTRSASKSDATKLWIAVSISRRFVIGSSQSGLLWTRLTTMKTPLSVHLTRLTSSKLSQSKIRKRRSNPLKMTLMPIRLAKKLAESKRVLMSTRQSLATKDPRRIAGTSRLSITCPTSKKSTNRPRIKELKESQSLSSATPKRYIWSLKCPLIQSSRRTQKIRPFSKIVSTN